MSVSLYFILTVKYYDKVKCFLPVPVLSLSGFTEATNKNPRTQPEIPFNQLKCVKKCVFDFLNTLYSSQYVLNKAGNLPHSVPPTPPFRLPRFQKFQKNLFKLVLENFPCSGRNDKKKYREQWKIFGNNFFHPRHSDKTLS